jgi:hypothetical protein
MFSNNEKNPPKKRKGTPQNTFSHLLSSIFAVFGPKKVKKNKLL